MQTQANKLNRCLFSRGLGADPSITTAVVWTRYILLWSAIDHDACIQQRVDETDDVSVSESASSTDVIALCALRHGHWPVIITAQNLTTGATPRHATPPGGRIIIVNIYGKLQRNSSVLICTHVFSRRYNIPRFSTAMVWRFSGHDRPSSLPSLYTP